MFIIPIQVIGKIKIGIDFNKLKCYRSDLATLTSVYFKERFEEEFIKLRVKSTVTKKSLTFHYLQATNQKNEGDWIFLFAGIGTKSDGAHQKKLSFFLRNSGYKGNLLLIPSVFMPEFVKSFSPNGSVGILPVDVKGLNQAIKTTIISLIKNKKMTFSNINYVGFSLGALTAAHLSTNLKEKDDNHAPNKVFIINSPVNLFKSLKKLDRISEYKSEINQNFRISKSYIKGQFLMTNQDNANKSFCSLQKNDSRIIEGVIAKSLASTIGNTFYFGQRRSSTGFFERSLGEIPRFSTQKEKNDYWTKAKKISNELSFQDYINFAVIPSFEKMTNLKNPTLEIINKAVSISGIKKEIKKFKQDYFLIHSTDDFLLSSQKEFNTYAQYFLKENSYIVKKGGHLGLLHNNETSQFIVNNLKYK